MFHNIVTEFWGLEKRKYLFYDDNGDVLEDEDTGIAGNRKLEKVMETVMTRELKDKDLQPQGPRRAMLYLGIKDTFDKKYKKLMSLLRERNDEDKAN